MSLLDNSKVYFRPRSAPERFDFSADEIMDLRRMLLPNRMRHHDTPGEARLRAHVYRVLAGRASKPPHD